MEPGIPVDKPGKADGDVKPTTITAVKAMKLDYYGNYDGMEKARFPGTVVTGTCRPPEAGGHGDKAGALLRRSNRCP